MDRSNNIIVKIIVIIIMSLTILFFISKKEYYSENEFRYLQSVPTLSIKNILNKKLINEIDDYVTDHFVFRIQFVKLKTFIKELMGEKLISNIYIGKDNYLLQKYTFDKDSNDKVINIINKFKDNNDVNMNMLLIPTSVEINKDKLPAYSINDSQIDTINYYINNTNINIIDVSSDLIDNKDNYQLYYRYDHHYTSYGAYITYKSYMNNINESYIDIDQFNIINVNDNFLGTLYSKVFPINTKKDSIYKFDYDNNITVKYINKITNTLYDESYLKEKDKYSYYLGGNTPLLEITNNDIKDNNSILIIKDSYANSLIPFLVNHYKYIHIIDLRYYNLPISNYIKTNSIDNILLVYNVYNIQEDTGILNLR